LRKLSDNTTSNVYVSNLPLDMTPHQLEQLFAPHLVVSLRILLDDNGVSRGVGFVRLRDRETAQECIDKLHGKVLSGQTTPLQARFADSEAQKRLKQSANQTAVKQQAFAPKSGAANVGGLLDGSGLPDPLYLASLQGLQNWAGFGTPQNSSAASFPLISPQLGMTSPAINYTQWSPGMAANTAANWNMLTTDMYPLLNNNLGNNNYGIHYGNNSIYSPSSMATSINSPFAQFSNKSLSPLSFASSPLSSASPVLGKSDSLNRPGSSRSKPTYLPPDVHQQHAKALLEAQAGLAFDSPQAEAFGLSQLLLNGNGVDYHQQAPPLQHRHLSHAYNPGTYTDASVAPQHTEVTSNALGMSGMIPQDASPPFETKPLPPIAAKMATVPLPLTPASVKNSTAVNGSTTAAAASLSPIRFSLSADPKNPITIEPLEKESECPSTALEDGASNKMPARVSTPMPTNVNPFEKAGNVQVQEAVTEEGDSLVIEAGNGGSAVGSFSSQQKNSDEQQQQREEIKGLSKSDSGKIFDVTCHDSVAVAKEDACVTKDNERTSLAI
jgi:hypothetical protein